MRRNYVRRILCLPSRVAHSLVWILPDCHGIVAFLVISGKQPSSELLHTLRFICVCVGHLRASVQYLRHLLHNTEALLVFQATFSHVSPSRLTSTTQPLATVPGYLTISTIVFVGNPIVLSLQSHCFFVGNTNVSFVCNPTGFLFAISLFFCVAIPLILCLQSHCFFRLQSLF